MPRSVRSRLMECDALIAELRSPMSQLHALDGARNPQSSLKEVERAIDKIVKLRVVLYDLYAHFEKQSQKKAS